jgi:hypothetical protein
VVRSKKIKHKQLNNKPTKSTKQHFREKKRLTGSELCDSGGEAVTESSSFSTPCTLTTRRGSLRATIGAIQNLDLKEEHLG